METKQFFNVIKFHVHYNRFYQPHFVAIFFNKLHINNEIVLQIQIRLEPNVHLPQKYIKSKQINNFIMRFKSTE